MKIKGRVEVYEVINGDKILVSSEDNLVVDGAGEAIADMLTMPSSTSTDSDVFDTSNFVVQAVSFGKASAVFNVPYLGAHIYSNTLSAEYAVETYMKALHSVDSVTASGIDDPSSLPAYPDPLDTGLEGSSITMYESSVGDTGLSKGHSLNRMAGNVEPSSIFVGCFAPASGIDLYIVSGDMETASTVTFSSTVSGHYNRAEVMDNDGHLQCNFRQNSIDNTRGCVVSGTNPNTTGNVTGSAAFLVNPAVNYSFTLSGPDKQMLNAYGGISHIGLWTIDVKESLANEDVPFSFTINAIGDTNRVYKLFSKKTFTENLTRMNNSASFTAFSDLFIQWKISFDFGTGSWA